MGHCKTTCATQTGAWASPARYLVSTCAALLALASGAWAQSRSAPARADTPPQVLQAQRFLARHGLVKRRSAGVWKARAGATVAASQSAPANANWEPLGPLQVTSANYGLVTGRVSSLAIDPSDTTANRLIVGTTGGGVWIGENAGTANVADLAFAPLTDRLSAMYGAEDSSISIGAVTFQPGGTGVILAGTGDPNDALDSYYGAGLLRSTDGGNTWSLILGTADTLSGLAAADHGFLGEGFAGFAWSTVTPQIVVAAVSQAYEGELVDADLAGYSYAGLYYSNDSGASWHLATITDGNGQDVQGPSDRWAGVDGNAATAVVWNPQRSLFIAAVRFHGYYQSPDGVTWTRMAAQPGTGLTKSKCPTNISMIGSTACPIFRGALAVNPITGDTFAWTVDLNNQDQGLWQDVCAANNNSCSNQNIAFGKQWSTAALEAPTWQGALAVPNGDYNLVLAAVPSGQDTLLLAGANDLWKCSLAMGCQWRNTTSATTCMSAQVGEYQHAIAWSAANPLEVFVGNDSGLWRSEDAIGETGSACNSSDASHWQNLNGALGSLAEVEDLSVAPLTPYTLMAGLGANGTAGLKGAPGPVGQWPQILGGEGGPVAIDAANPDNWYANNGAGVSIHLCAQAGDCSAADFGTQPVVTDQDTGNDGLTMTAPAPFLVDPLDPSKLLIGTCRIWRGPASGNGWTPGNAITSVLGGGSDCGSSPLIRSLAAAALPGGGEIVFAGLFGAQNGGGNMGGHVLAVTMSSGGTWSGWNDLTLNPVTNDTVPFNAYNLDVSSLTIDPHDATGQTIYAAIAGISSRSMDIRSLYRSTDGGGHWTPIASNLIYAPANALVVDPVDANTVYVGTDAGVFATRQVATCGNLKVSCWAAYGSGLPEAPVTTLASTQPSSSLNVLVAGTYGRGVWQIPLLTAGQQMTTAAAPSVVDFGNQAEDTASAAQPLTVKNTGGIALSVNVPASSGDFAVSDPNHCAAALIDTSQSCSFLVTFSPSALGTRTAQLTIQGNLATGNLVVTMKGTGVVPPQVTLSPGSVDFGDVEVGTTYPPPGSNPPGLPVTAVNRSGLAAAISSVKVTGPFIVTNGCGSAIPANGQCALAFQFSPTSEGPATGLLTVVDDGGTQTVQLTGTGTARPTDDLAPASLSFPATVVGVSSTEQKVTLTNSGANPLTSIAVATAAGSSFQVKDNTCTTQLIGPNSCTIGVVFIPTAVGPQSGTLTISDILRTQTIPLLGTGLKPPAFTVTPPSLTFSGGQTGVASAPQTLTVTNSGGAPMANVGFAITGAAASAFAVTPNPCAAELDPNSSCTAQVTFTPPASGPISANLVVSTSTPGSGNTPINQTVPLNGGGADAGTLLAQPGQVNFPVTGVGQTSSAIAVTLTNQSASKAFNNFAVTPSAGFQAGSSGCPGSLAAGGACTIPLTFAPTAAGPLTGTLTITSADLAAPILVPLSGTGFDYTPAITGSATQTISSGETATYALSLSPSAGAAASFTFQCSSLPQYASCGFNPATLAVAAGATGTETVQIATSQGGSAAMERPAGLRGPAAGVLGCGLLLLWPLARRRRRAWILLILLAVGVMAGGMGCSGSGGGSGGTVQVHNSTPAGTYTVQVVVSSSGVQHKVTLTLVVD